MFSEQLSGILRFQLCIQVSCMAEEEKCQVNKPGAQKNFFWRVFDHQSEEVLSGNDSWDVLTGPVEKIKWTQLHLPSHWMLGRGEGVKIDLLTSGNMEVNGG